MKKVEISEAGNASHTGQKRTMRLIPCGQPRQHVFVRKILGVSVRRASKISSYSSENALLFVNGWILRSMAGWQSLSRFCLVFVPIENSIQIAKALIFNSVYWFVDGSQNIWSCWASKPSWSIRRWCFVSLLPFQCPGFSPVSFWIHRFSGSYLNSLLLASEKNRNEWSYLWWAVGELSCGSDA